MQHPGRREVVHLEATRHEETHLDIPVVVGLARIDVGSGHHGAVDLGVPDVDVVVLDDAPGPLVAVQLGHLVAATGKGGERHRHLDLLEEPRAPVRVEMRRVVAVLGGEAPVGSRLVARDGFHHQTLAQKLRLEVLLERRRRVHVADEHEHHAAHFADGIGLVAEFADELAAGLG